MSLDEDSFPKLKEKIKTFFKGLLIKPKEVNIKVDLKVLGKKLLKQLPNLFISSIVTVTPFALIDIPEAHAEDTHQFIPTEVKYTYAPIKTEELNKEIKPLPTEIPTQEVNPKTSLPIKKEENPKPKASQTQTSQLLQNTHINLSLSQLNKQFIWPVAGNAGQISRGLGGGHNGIDIWANSSPWVVAISNGIVTSTGWENGGGGYVVRIKFDNGFAAQYAHTVGNFQVIKGQRVSQGQTLATMGRTGNSTGIHLHIEMYDPSGKIVNGLNYFSK